MKISRLRHYSQCLRFKPPRCINPLMLHLLVPRVGEYNIRMVRRIDRMGKVRGVERIKRIKGVEEAFEEIR